LVIQILLDVLHQYKQVRVEESCDNGSSMISSILVGMFASLSRIARRRLFIHSSDVHHQSSIGTISSFSSQLPFKECHQRDRRRFFTQGYPSDQIKPLLYSVPSMHICLDFIPQMLASPNLDIQVTNAGTPQLICRLSP
jgi:hypothetical protein